MSDCLSRASICDQLKRVNKERMILNQRLKLDREEAILNDLLSAQRVVHHFHQAVCPPPAPRQHFADSNGGSKGSRAQSTFKPPPRIRLTYDERADLIDAIASVWPGDVPFKDLGDALREWYDDLAR